MSNRPITTRSRSSSNTLLNITSGSTSPHSPGISRRATNVVIGVTSSPTTSPKLGSISPLVHNRSISKHTKYETLITKIIRYIRHYKNILLFILPLTILYALYMYIVLNEKCQMSGNLKHLFMNTTEQFKKHNIEYFLDFGSLLGAIRDNGLMPWEFDIDIGIKEEHCQQVMSIRNTLEKPFKYHVYDQTEWIPQKYNPVLGYSGYISSPCVRIYDENQKYYVDVYWYTEYTAKQILDRTASYTRLNGDVIQPIIPDALPLQYYSTLTEQSENVWCNDDGHTGEAMGGCRPHSHVYPLQWKSINIDSETQAQIAIPNQPEQVLAQMYGPSWCVI